MAEDWDAIATEVASALAEVGYEATLTRSTGGPATPWEAGSPTVTTFAVTVLDDGFKRIYTPDMVTRTAHMLTIATGVTVPVLGDTITLRGVVHEVLVVMPLAPGGVDLLFDVEIKG